MPLQRAPRIASLNGTHGIAATTTTSQWRATRRIRSETKTPRFGCFGLGKVVLRTSALMARPYERRRERSARSAAPTRDGARALPQQGRSRTPRQPATTSGAAGTVQPGVEDEARAVRASAERAREDSAARVWGGRGA